MAANGGLGLEITELRLGLPGGGGGCGGGAGRVVVSEERSNEKKKRVFSQVEGRGDPDERKRNTKSSSGQVAAQPVVGWPPVCSYRRRNSFNAEESTKIMYVKVSMDGAPFLRKINLTALKDYSDLQMNLEKLFGSSFSAVEAESSEYVPIYEDKEGDWMLVGDVPWTMFMESCKKLRIMKRAEAIGIGLGGTPKSCRDG